MDYTEKNNNRKNHKGGNHIHIEARSIRRLIGGAFGDPKATIVSMWGWNDLIAGTSGAPRGGA